MPRVRKATTNGKEKGGGDQKPPKVAYYLADGHPNPAAMTVWEFMQALTDDQWTEYIGYLYRVEPKKIPTANPTYIAVIPPPITQEEIRLKYGGNKFTLHFNRRVGTRQNKIYTPIRFDIEARPIWQDGERPIDPGRGGHASSAAGGVDPTVLEGLTYLISNLVALNAEALRTGKTFLPTAAM